MAGNSLGFDISPLATAAQEAKNILICIHPQSTYDAVAAALAWKLTWEKADKAVSVVCSAPMRAEYERLQGLEAISAEAGNRDLVMAFPYDDNVVDKVSYNVNESTNQFELIISPKNGFLPLNPQQIEFRQAGLAADVVILFGFHSFDELGEVYQNERFAIDRAFTMAVTQSKVSAFAKFHVALQNEHFSYSELTYFILRQLQIGSLEESAATNLLQGVEYATDRLVAVQNARTFETVANLMRSRARRQPDNPAFAILATPIEGPAASDAWQPAAAPQPAYEAPQTMSAPYEPPVASSVSQRSGVPQLSRKQRPAAKPHTPNEFAQAMVSRS